MGSRFVGAVANLAKRVGVSATQKLWKTSILKRVFTKRLRTSCSTVFRVRLSSNYFKNFLETVVVGAEVCCYAWSRVVDCRVCLLHCLASPSSFVGSGRSCLRYAWSRVVHNRVLSPLPTLWVSHVVSSSIFVVYAVVRFVIVDLRTFRRPRLLPGQAGCGW